jgi:ketosteroid isomerase-like protein
VADNAPPSVHPFRAAVERGDVEGAIALLADDVVFYSPVVFRPYQGREAVATLLRAVFHTFEDFRYEREFGPADARDHALMFRTRVGDREVQGADFLQTAPDGSITELTVMVRPLSGAHALAAAMKARLEAVDTSRAESINAQPQT